MALRHKDRRCFEPTSACLKLDAKLNSVNYENPAVSNHVILYTLKSYI
jgi:hypothetical protein